ncbi:class III lanthionine synthetase LanKC [Ornithinibacillus massiliensis]|uniref:Class III lanthionine synthetase LanKC n=1 Tax=Ornithinibacillus massiliensis TaxID=1944633 RepID=A0ABS5M9E3_9BACI|nr:class III lanthionine synthetase LanKC [Ornithinibacillus massiliensis]MBS3678770.1 class III lanthionine synthetase LanKC [Ornithinibacillus massiliensis]
MDRNFAYYDYLNEDSNYFVPIKPSYSGEEYSVVNLPDGCIISDDERSVWKVYNFKESVLIEQGWKIHISATINKAKEVLSIVSDLLIDRKIAFKHLKSEYEFINTNSKTANRASSGKFITIYPPSNEEFLNLLNLLYDKLKLYEKGPYIFSDKRWRDSNIYYRYGGFIAIYNEDGEMCIKDEEGNLIEDERVPYYQVPEMAKEFDQFLDTLNSKYTVENNNNSKKFAEYEFKSAIRFTNGGGIYEAMRKKDERKVIIKEARPKAGLDGQKYDALERQKIEYDALTKLSKVDGVVNVLDYFTYWEHSYLVEEYVEGISLEHWTAANYPYTANSDVITYKGDIINIISNLVDIVDNMHKEGIGMGDLQPANIIVSQDLKVTLIDFETARPKDYEGKSPMRTYAYSHPENKNNGERDWYAIKKILRYCFMPIGNIEDIDPGMYEYQYQWIVRTFGEDSQNFLQGIIDKCNKNLSIKEKPNYADNHMKRANNIPSIIEGIRNGILKNLVYGDKLVQGDIRQYIDNEGKLNVQNGAAGAILAFSRSGILTDDVNHWVKQKFIQNLGTVSQNGLFTGKAGIGALLYEIGYRTEALNIFEEIDTNLDPFDITLRSGLAGIGLMLISLYLEVKDEQYLSEIESISKSIDNFISENNELTSKDWSGIPIGIIDGWSGVSLFYSALYSITKDESHYFRALDLINKDLEKTQESKMTLQTLDDANRLLPYLSGGSIGIGIAIVYLNHVSGKRHFQKELSLITNLSSVKCTINAGLYDGAGSFLLIPPMLGQNNSNYIYSREYVMNLISLFFICKRDHILIPGYLCYRLSDDFQTGGSGIILALQGILKDNPLYTLPLINIDSFYNRTSFLKDESKIHEVYK